MECSTLHTTTSVFCLVLLSETYRPLYLGCWTEAREHVIPDVDEFANHANSADVFTSCERLARNRGFMVFGVANDTRCVGSVHAQLLYMKYGPSQKCVNGTGGIGAADFYSLEGRFHRTKLNKQTNQTYKTLPHGLGYWKQCQIIAYYSVHAKETGLSTPTGKPCRSGDFNYIKMKTRLTNRRISVALMS